MGLLGPVHQSIQQVLRAYSPNIYIVHKRRSSTKIRESNRAEEVKLPRKADYYKTLQHGVVTNLRTNKIPIMH